jgi:hypothetical protein
MCDQLNLQDHNQLASRCTGSQYLNGILLVLVYLLLCVQLESVMCRLGLKIL